MTADDCVKVIAGVAAAQVATLAALLRVYVAVRRNAERLGVVADLASTMGANRT